MNNPWEEISLSDYENHMSLESVNQLQTMNSLMKKQFSDYQVKTAMVLGIAGGNGLEHVRSGKLEKVYGIDINEGYLKTVEERYKDLAGILECLCIDLITEPEKLPHSDLVIANLLIAIKKIDPEYVSCVIQINTDEAQWVSDSPYLHAFDRLDEVHCQMEENALITSMKEIGYCKILNELDPLPNGKALQRIDFRKQ